MNTAWDALFNAASGLVLVALGLWIATLKPRTRPAIALAVFACAFGAFMALWNTRTPQEIASASLAFRAVVVGLVVIVAVALSDAILRLPRPIHRADRHLIVFPAILGVVVAVFGWLIADTFEASLAGVLYGTFYFGAALAAVRYRDAIRRGSPSERSQLLLVGSALVLYPGTAIGSNLDLGSDGWLLFVGAVASVLVVSALWLANTDRAPGGESAGPRNVALLTLAVPVATSIFAVTFRDSFDEVGGGPQWGASRIATTLVLGYAILRLQLLGIDVKLRFAISKSTVAAAFIAVFFLASEGAQLFFGQGNAIVGLVAAAALVFVMAPLQRAADRLAERAVPPAAVAAVHTPSPTPPDGSDEDLYRRALRLALADRRLTHEEELTLAELSERLRIGHKRALELRHEIERERGTRREAT